MRVFTHTVRVPYAHTDQMSYVYYAHYFLYFEMARSELLREVGLPYGEMEQRGIRLPVVEAWCSYKKPAHFDELLTIRSRCTEARGPRLRLEYELTRGDELLAAGYTVHVTVSPEGKVLRRVPELEALRA